MSASRSGSCGTARREQVDDDPCGPGAGGRGAVRGPSGGAGGVLAGEGDGAPRAREGVVRGGAADAGSAVGPACPGLGRPSWRRRSSWARSRCCFGDGARSPRAVFLRQYGIDPYTEGYVTEWRPGDVLGVGPLQGTHEPPLYFCGSDHWVAGYMEGAVRIGRAAATAALGGARLGQSRTGRCALLTRSIGRRTTAGRAGSSPSDGGRPRSLVTTVVANATA